MTESRNLKIKKSLAVLTALLLGVLMPYLSRIPLAFTYGISWIWKFLPDFDAFTVWNEAHLFSLAPVLMFGIVFVFANVKWTFYVAALAHLAATFFFYYNFEETRQRDDFLSFLFFPFLIGAPSFLFGLIALVAELLLDKRKRKFQIKAENKIENLLPSNQ